VILFTFYLKYVIIIFQIYLRGGFIINMNFLEKQFKLKENGTDIKTELIAGLTTFATMAYVLATVPSIMSSAGFGKSGVLTMYIMCYYLYCYGNSY
jgi:xanthine/uracil/vitamin C permease (AzgA family)